MGLFSVESVENEFIIDIFGDLQGLYRIWDGGDYCKNSPFTTTDCSSFRGYTFGMSITDIRHVDNWGVFGTSIAGVWNVNSCRTASPISIYAIGVSEYWANNDFYVIWSIAM